MSKKTTILPSDRLCAILVLAAERMPERDPIWNLPVFNAHDYELQRIFYRIQEPMSYRQVRDIDGFLFCPESPGPYSPALHEAITHLQVSGIISRKDSENPRAVYLNPSGKSYYDDVLRQVLTEEDIRKYDGLAAMFLDKIRTLN